MFPDIDGNVVVWEDWRNGKMRKDYSGNSDIYAFLLNSKATIPVCVDRSQQSFPAVSG